MTKKQAALKDIDIIIDELSGALTAALECKRAIIDEDRAKLDEALIKLDDIDLIEVSGGSMSEYLAELQEFDAAPSASDDSVDDERIGKAMAEA